MRVAVYTAIFGGYDDLKAQPQQTVPCDWFCFTDAAGPGRRNGWRIIRERRQPGLHPRMRAKRCKLMAHEFFPDGRLSWRHAPLLRRPRYDALVWIDGSIQVTNPRFVEEFVAGIGPSGWAMLAHPERDCIYDELHASALMQKYAGLPMARQVGAYRAEGYPANNGLMACGLIARRPGDSRLAGIAEAWWQENVRWTYQDQLSLPVVLWRLGAGVDVVQRNLWDNDWFTYVHHSSEA